MVTKLNQDIGLGSDKANPNVTAVWEPQIRQQWLISCPVFETLYGGARGGGKTDAVLGEFAAHAAEHGENAVALCVRRERTQLTEMIQRSKILYLPLKARFLEIDKMWIFPNGARLRFAHLENDTDAESYQGHNYTRLYVEELGNFPSPTPIYKLMATLSRNPKVQSRFIATCNPGGPGHLWIKKRYIDPAPTGLKIIPTIYTNPFTGEKITKERVFIPALVTDNKYTNTSEYIGNLQLSASGNEQLLKAWLMGDWDVTLGAFFNEWDLRKHVIKTFTPPRHWTRFMSMDWGSSRPFAIHWWCIVPDEFDPNADITPDKWQLFDTRSQLTLPRGAMICYREWYGSASEDNPNTGLKLTVEQVAAGIVSREINEPKNSTGRPRISYRVADPSMSREDGGPSMFERMAARPYYIALSKADNKRTGKLGAVGGWDQLRARLRGEDDRPMIYFMECCKDVIRTLPSMQHDSDNIEDIDTEGEDHCVDSVRYASMSRPYARPTAVQELRNILHSKDNGVVLTDIIEEDDFSIHRMSPEARIH